MDNPELLKQDPKLMDGCESEGREETSLSRSTQRNDIAESELASEEESFMNSKTLSTSNDLKSNITVSEHNRFTLPTSHYEISADTHRETEIRNNTPRTTGCEGITTECQLMSETEPATAHIDQTLPSIITDDDYIFYNNPSIILADTSKIGKWLLFCDIGERCSENNMTDLDRAWLKTIDLIKSTNLRIIRAKCSTAAKVLDCSVRSTPHGVIMFYTPNFTNKAEVRSIADEIYLKIGKTEDSASTLFEMFYKTDEASRQGEYVHHQKRNISTYSYRNGAFFERDMNSYEWKLVRGSSGSNSDGHYKQGSPFKRQFARR
ncbi:uncharacterized protein LOC118197291 [Stegodyphus dumicola]|uniref:uncharacterized protein LOC118197291 n=1 Tax=Stegodyphus dumicola TaxID=202533 RepID=UPI0015AAE9DE|nr:uncharacterized protein LOC118197291 [Stegodyphus dumicola]XP_035224676.1 uncharacterized protein LOC118197291 [Stegodyphus dumicola]